MAKNRPTKIVSRKHLARLERERRQTAAILYTAIAILVIVVVMISYGILNETGILTDVILAGQPVEKVNDDALTTHEFQLRVKVARQNLIDQYIQYFQLAQMFGMDPTTDTSISSYLQQIQSQLDDSSSLGNQVLEAATNNLLIRQYARDHGIVISEQDVDKAVQDAFRYYPNGTPTSTVTSTPFAYPTLSSTQLAFVTATFTPSPFPTATPPPTATIDRSATATPIPTVIPSPTPYTETAYNTNYQNALDYYEKLGMNEPEFRRILFEDRLYQQRVEDAVLADFPHDQEQVWARHILTADEETAQKVRQLLLSGEDWGSVTATYSTDTGSKNSGGDLGWFGRGKMVAEFEKVAFELSIGEISQPVQSTYGWHIIQVLGHENRPLTADEYKTARDQKFTDWLTGQKTNAKVTLYDYWVDRIPSKPTLSDTFAEMSRTQTAVSK